MKRDRWRSASLYFAEERYRDAYELLIGYVEEFDPTTGKDEDDPYILRMAGECLFQLSRKSGNRVTMLEEARSLYARAMTIMNHRRRIDPKNERMFWTWGYRWCQINRHLGREGEQNAYRMTPSGEPAPNGLNNRVPAVKKVGYSIPPAPLP